MCCVLMLGCRVKHVRVGPGQMLKPNQLGLLIQWNLCIVATPSCLRLYSNYSTESSPEDLIFVMQLKACVPHFPASVNCCSFSHSVYSVECLELFSSKELRVVLVWCGFRNANKTTAMLWSVKNTTTTLLPLLLRCLVQWMEGVV